MLQKHLKKIIIIKILSSIVGIGIFFYLFLIDTQDTTSNSVVFLIDNKKEINQSAGVDNTSKLDVIKNTISKSISEDDNNNYGIVLFGNQKETVGPTSTYLIPPTGDKYTLEHYLSSLRENTIITPTDKQSEYSSDILDGIHNFSKNTSPGSSGILFLASDDYNIDENESNEVRNKLAAKSQSLKILGIGEQTNQNISGKLGVQKESIKEEKDIKNYFTTTSGNISGSQQKLLETIAGILSLFGI
ncbi:vWA domain-containing protein [Candidatus Absconditicoccus praedator]|uniref:vWA domain-containing protein n=1 Tax=Candidatus Absconditicoccus praedator TaxID=2735562 RepID=UPI001E34B7AD|nr:VWA domain-containing protein [Candidatus Absconditicoccus praedator]UFX83470.1 VWA domain-containing protein [Candidatus Absconditicoccus praedator]